MTYTLNPDTFTTWHLSSMADCGSPDRGDGIGTIPPTLDTSPSPGALFLRRVAEGVAEMIDYQAEDFDPERYNDDGSGSEIADGAVPIYTHEMWAAFVDLAAYQEDPTELGADASDMGKCAGVCLYVIAERLVSALVRDMVENADEAEDVAA